MIRKYIIAILVLATTVDYLAAQQSATMPPGSPGASPDGILRPWREADAATAESGLVQKILVKVGDYVKSRRTAGAARFAGFGNTVGNRSFASCCRRATDYRSGRSGFPQTQARDALEDASKEPS